MIIKLKKPPIKVASQLTIYSLNYINPLNSPKIIHKVCALPTMKVFLVIALILGAALAAPKRETHFRNLFRKPVGALKHAPSGRITNGEIAKPHSIPYQAFLEVHDGAGSAWYCGGSLIKENVVLTAGSCAYGGNQVVVTLGAHTPLKPEDSQVKVISKDIVVHENFDIEYLVNDIALIRLATPVALTDAIQLAKLPADNMSNYEGRRGRVSGWGLTSGFDDSLSEELRYTEERIISNEKCSGYLGDVQDTLVCLSGTGGRGSCNGDSGGPLTLVLDGEQIGVVSYVIMACLAGFPTAYTRVGSYLDWIEANSQV